MAIQSVKRAFSILNLFTYRQFSLTLSEIAEQAGLPLSTAQGLVHTLTEEGVLRKDAETKRYRLGNRLSILGSIQTATLEVNQMGAASAHALARETGFMARLAIWEDDGVLITLDALGKPEASRRYHFGNRLSAYCTGLGKAMLAFFSDEFINDYLDRLTPVPYTPHTLLKRSDIEKDLIATRKRGYAISDREYMRIQAGLAAPLFGKDGSVCAALSISGAPEEILFEHQQKNAQRLLEKATEISGYLGYYPTQTQE
jgi:DNA-binding IclR family transcriptional regulator